MLPNYLIIGAPRCGTTWLARNLRTHPQIFMPNVKELHFFDQNYDKGIDWYENFFLDCNHIAVGEATPAYLYYKNIPELIHRHLPDCKLIVSLRDPVGRAYSHYWYRMSEIKKQNNNISFEDYIENNERLIEEGLYGENLSRYYQLFPKDKLLVLFYEDIKINPKEYLNSVFKFLGVDTDFESTYVDKVVNSSASRSRSTVMHSLSRKLSKLQLHNLSNLTDKLFSKDIPPISPEVRKTLIDQYYIDDINKLEKLINQDLSHWK